MNTKSVTNGKELTVHMEGQEGTLQIDALTGVIKTPINDRPDWAEGYAAAAPAERLAYYQGRLGKDSPEFKAIQDATAVHASDLEWVVVNAEQKEDTQDASDDFRMATISKALGIDQETGDIKGVTAEREVSAQNRGRSQEEITAMDAAVDQGFPEQSQEGARATGTHGE